MTSGKTIVRAVLLVALVLDLAWLNCHATTPAPTFPSNHPLRASAGGLFGTQAFGPYGSQTNQAQDKTLIEAGTCAFLSPLLPPPQAGEHIGAAAYVQIDYAGSPSGISCDAGGCVADIRRYFPGVLQGGQFCRGDGVCTDQPIDSYVNDAGVLGGSGATTATIAWIDASSTLEVQACCHVTCVAAAGIAAQRGLAGESGAL
jgi:hypothetical protein